MCYRAQPLVLRIRLGCGGWAAGYPATHLGAGLAFEFRLGAEVMMVMFISVCYCLSGKLCLDPSACVVSGRPDSIWAPPLGQG